MALWEYKVITSGQHGFATPALLEAHLNSLGKDEWEIIHFQTLPNNPLAFNGLVRRSTVRDWVPPVPATPASTLVSSAPKASEAPAAAPQRAEPAHESAAAAEDKPAAGDDKAPVREESMRTVRNTDRDLDPDAEEDEESDWDNWEENQDELPTFFEAIRPHMRRNQKGPGSSVGVDFLAKRWDLRESDVVAALKECGFTLPENEDSEPEYFEFEGDLYWVNRNNRGQLFLNSREKPRAVFRTVAANRLSPDDPATAELVAERAAEKAENEKRNQERAQREAERQAAAQARAEAQAAARAARQAAQAEGGENAPASESQEGGQSGQQQFDAPAPTGNDLIDQIRPHMRRNRRGPGYSGSTQFLSRALKCSEKSLVEAFAALGLEAPASPGAKPTNVDIGNGTFWMNRDGRGGIWINGRENRGGGRPPEDASANGEGAAPDMPPDAGSAVSEAVAAPTVTPTESATIPSPDAAPQPQGEPAAAEAPAQAAPAEPAGASQGGVSGEPASASEGDSKDEGAKPKRKTSRPRTRKPKADGETAAES